MSPKLMRKASFKRTTHHHSVTFKKSADGLGFSFEPIRVFVDDKYNYILHHLIKVIMILIVIMDLM